MAVAEAVANKTELKKLDLNGERRTHSMGGSSLAFTLPSSGNCVGEEGIERLRESLEAKGKLDTLGSLSDDEGAGSEEEEEEEEGEEEVSREQGAEEAQRTAPVEQVSILSATAASVDLLWLAGTCGGWRGVTAAHCAHTVTA